MWSNFVPAYFGQLDIWNSLVEWLDSFASNQLITQLWEIEIVRAIVIVL